MSATAGFAVLGGIDGTVSFSKGDTPVLSYMYDMSDDGSTIVGFSPSANGPEAYRWTGTGGMAGLGDLDGGYYSSSARTVDATGAVVAGYSIGTNGPEAFRWTEAGGMVGLGDLAGGEFYSSAIAISSDGAVIVGQSLSADGPEAFRWTEAGGMVGLGDMDGGTFDSAAMGIDDTGSVVVGYATTSNGTEAFRWTEVGGMSSLGDLAGGEVRSLAYGVSPNGSVVVGGGSGDNGLEAFRWTREAGMAGLGDLPGGDFYSCASDVADDGSVVVGFGSTADGFEPFLWTEAAGMQRLADWFAARGIPVANDFSLVSRTEPFVTLSDDGTTIASTGTNAEGNQEAWLARAGSGILALDSELQQSLAAVAAAPQGTHRALTLILNGAHHRPLMMQRPAIADDCFWATGDLARYEQNRHDTDAWLVEMGACKAFGTGAMVAGIGIGKAGIDQNLSYSGQSESSGNYLLLEVDYQSQAKPWLLSLTGIYGHWDTDIERGYLNGGAIDVSHGNTDLRGSALRARVDWLDIAQAGGFALSPSIQYAVSRTAMDGYTETGGGFPTSFNRQSHAAQELRIGVRGKRQLDHLFTLHAGLEAVHRFDRRLDQVSGQVNGLFAFNLRGTPVQRDWLRARVEVDGRLGSTGTISASLTAAGDGEDPDIGAALGYKAIF